MLKIVALSLCMFMLNLHEDEVDKGEILLKVEGIKTADGALGILIFNQSEGFPEVGEKAIINKTVKVTSIDMTIPIGELPYGNYAIAIVHDVNENEAFDKNLLGIPKEPFGFSNNKSILFGLPDFEEATVELKSDQQETTIKLINLY